MYFARKTTGNMYNNFKQQENHHKQPNWLFSNEDHKHKHSANIERNCVLQKSIINVLLTEETEIKYSLYDG